MKQRLAFIDRAKGIGILMVVFSHLSSMTGFGNRLWSWYNPFMLTLFFMISGGMRRKRERRKAFPEDLRNREKRKVCRETARDRGTFPSFVRRRAHALLLPYFVFGILALGIQTVLNYWRGGVPEAAAKLQIGLERIFTLQGLGPDWFLPVLFFAELLLDLCLRYGRKSIAEVREYCRSGGDPGTAAKTDEAAGGISSANADEAAGGISSANAGGSLPFTTAVLFAVSVVAVLCLGGDRLAVLGPFRFVIVKALAAAGFLVLGYVCMPIIQTIPGLLPAAAISLIGTLLIAGRYNLDFNQLDFGSRPLLLYAYTLFGTCFVLCVSRIPDLIGERFGGEQQEKQGRQRGQQERQQEQQEKLQDQQEKQRENPRGLLQAFGRESLTIMCTHLEWQIVPIIHFGWAAVAGMSPQEGKRFYAEMLIKLGLVMAVELGLIPALRRLMPWLYRKPAS